jgi:type IV secretory pathway TrbL component
MEEKNETPQPPPIIDQLRDYAETRIKLAKYQAIEGGTSIAASLIADVAVLITGILAFIFASFTLAFLLGSLFGATWIGFGCVSIIYFLIALVVKYKKSSLEKPIVNAIIQKIFKS